MRIISNILFASIVIFTLMVSPALAADKVIVASKIDTEGALLGNMIILMLENAGIAAEDKTEFGPTPMVRKAIAADAKNGISFQLGLDHTLYGEFFKRQGDRAKAKEELVKAAEVMRECGADGWAEKYEKEIAEL